MTLASPCCSASSKALSSRLVSAVKRCSMNFDVLVSSSRLGKGSDLKRLVKY